MCRSYHRSTSVSLFIALMLLFPAILCISAHADIPLQEVGQYGGQVAGSAQSGQYMYIGCGPKVLVVDTTYPVNRVVVGQSELLPRRILDVALSGNTLYALCDNRTIYILDISAPTQPTLVGNCVLAADTSKLKVSGNNLYGLPPLPSGAWLPTALRVIDISSPRAPVERGSYLASNTIVDAAVKGDYVYLALNSLYVEIVDARDPDHPALVAQASTPRVPRAICIDGNRMFTIRELWIEVFDLTNPTAPVFVSTVETYYVGAVTANADYLYSSTGSPYHLRTIDITDPLHPINVQYLGFQHRANSWAVCGSSLFALGDDLHLLDISAPGSPDYRGRFNVGAAPSGIAVDGQYAFLPDGYNGLSIIDSRDPANQRLAARTCLDRFVSDVAVRDGYAYVTAGEGLRIYSVSDPYIPTLIGEVAYPAGGYARYVTLGGKYAYLYGEQKILTVDVSNPAAPTIVGSFDARTVICLAAANGLIYYIDTPDVFHNLKVVDISDPASPVEKYSMGLGIYDYGLAVRGKYLYLAGYPPSNDAFTVYDASDPTAPVNVGQCTITSDFSRDVSLSGNYAFVSMDSSGMQVVDISNPAAPVPVGTIGTDGYSMAANGSGGYAYVADKEGGMSTISVGGLWVEDIMPRIAANTGVTGTMVITGSGFQSGATVKLTRPGATDIPAGNKVVTANRITCTFDLAGASLGLWDLVVTNAGAQSARIPEIVSVQAAVPAITGITPDSSWNEFKVDAEIIGMQFPANARVKLVRAGEIDIAGTDTVVHSPTWLTCSFNLIGRTPGKWDIVLLQDGEPIAVKVDGFEVLWPPPVEIDSVSPASVYNNGVVALTINGSGFIPGATVGLQMLGESGITATDVVVSSSTSISCKADLTLKRPGSWCVYVRNPSGVQSGCHATIEVVSAARYAKSMADGQTVNLSPFVVTAAFGSWYYVELEDRSVGLLVYSPTLTGHVGDIVSLCGTMQTNASGERYVNGELHADDQSGIIEPIAMSIKALGGANWNYNSTTGAGQKGVTGGLGLNNIGLLVSVAGKVTFAGPNYFWVDDGSGVKVGAYKGVKVQANGLTVPALDSYVKVTGISSIYVQGSLTNRVMLTRSQADVVPVQAP